MNDLERFLQQAAERMKQRLEQQQQQAEQQKRPAPAPVQRSVRQVERAARRAEPGDDELVEAEIVDHPHSSPGHTQFGTVAARKPPVTAGVDMADERMAERLHQVFDHSIGKIRQPSVQPTVSTPARRSQANQTNQTNQTNQRSEVQRRVESVSPLISMLSNGDSLRAAFIISEIFQRRF
jgi:hypothetical protein